MSYSFHLDFEPTDTLDQTQWWVQECTISPTQLPGTETSTIKLIVLGAAFRVRGTTSSTAMPTKLNLLSSRAGLFCAMVEKGTLNKIANN
jgi:hypothetical protein